MSTIRRCGWSVILIGIGCVLGPGVLVSQEPTPVGGTTVTTPVGSAVDPATLPISVFGTRPRTLLEGPISRTEYPLGPGDVLTISLFGFRSEVVNVEVAPEGTIVVPEVGVVRVGGLNLEQAERATAAVVRRYYDDVEVNLTLSALRSFKVYVVGNVPNPGVREATVVTRISEIIRAISEDGVIHRNIVVRRANGSELRVDLARFQLTGNMGENPTLREGDIIHVPPVDRIVSVWGSVAFPGRYEFKPSESVAELLVLANGGGGFPADAADSVRLRRFTDDTTGVVSILGRGEAMGAPGQSLLLEPFDALFVPRVGNYRQSASAIIGGEVARPGTYPIEPNVTTVGELVAMAGGLTEEASLIDATLRREPAEVAGRGDSQLETIPPDMLSRDELRILQVTSRADAGNVVMDLEELLGSGVSASDIPLERGDQLFIPERRDEVVVLGAVMQPGIVTFRPGQEIDYYVAMAGGYTRRSDRDDVAILKGRQGVRLTRRDVMAVDRGDRIVVPFKEPVTFLERVQTVQGVASTISGLLLTIVAIDRLWN